MSKRNVRYLRQDPLKGAKKTGILKEKHGDGSLLSKTKSAKLDDFQGIQGKEVAVKSRKSTRSMPKKGQKNKPSLGVPALHGGRTKKERLANIKTRVLALKYGNIWQKKTFGSVSPAKARNYYEKQVLKKSLRHWEDIWWNGKNEWKLNIRADYHNRFRLWLKVWRAWRSFINLKRIKKTRMNLAQVKANHVHLAKFFVSWKTYVTKRHKKKEFHHWAQEETKLLSMKRIFAKWKNCLIFKTKLLSMEEQALHFWARNLFYKAWETWIFNYNLVLEEKHKYVFAVQIYNRRLGVKVFSSFKLYGLQRKLKKLRLRSAERFHRLQFLRFWFLTWKVTMRRKKELARFDETVEHKGEEAKKRRMFLAWKCYITLCHRKQQSAQKAWNHFKVSLKTKCLKALQRQVVDREKKALWKITAVGFHNTLLVRKMWILWLKKCENCEELRLITVNNLVRNHYKKALLKRMMSAWRVYCECRRLREVGKQRADEMAMRNLLPRYFGRWEVFIEIVKEWRTTVEKAEGFRRECLLAKTYYHWWRLYQQALDVHMLYRMAVISYDEKLTRQFFTIWSTKARWKLKENSLMKRGQHHYERQLKKKCLLAWNDFFKDINLCTRQLGSAVRHRNTRLLGTCWTHWTEFILKKRAKWKLVAIADLCFHHRILRKTLFSWKIHCNRISEIKSYAEERNLENKKITSRAMFRRWRKHARCLKELKEDDHKAFRYWKWKTERQVFEAWRIYAVNSRFKKENTLSRVAEAQNDLKRDKLRRFFLAWRRTYSLKIKSDSLLAGAREHWKRRTLKKSVDLWMKYRFLGYRKVVLRQQCMWYHNYRIIASFLEIWKVNYKLRVEGQQKCRIALWMWSFTLQRKTFAAWFRYAKDKKRRKCLVNEALARRSHWLQKVGVTQWINFATYTIAERETFAASRHVRLSEEIQRCVQRCAVHWRRKTERNRDKRCQTNHHNILPTTATNLLIKSAFDKADNGKDKSATIENIEVVIHQMTKRPKPRRPEYLRESFNFSEICEDEPAATSTKPDPEAFPRQWRSDFKPADPPPRLREPNSFSSTEGLAQSRDSRGSPEGRKGWSANMTPRGGHVLLPPSCFVGGMDQKRSGHLTDEETHMAEQTRDNNSLGAGAVPHFLCDKESQQSIVQLRDRMVKYYTVSMQIRDLRRRLKSLRQWSSQPREESEKNKEELTLIHELISKLSDDANNLSRNLDISYETITSDLQQLLGKMT